MSQLVGIVLAAGFGTRLRPSTDFYPKPLIPVAGIEPLFYALERFDAMGIRRVIVNAHYRHQDILYRLKDWAKLLPQLEIRCSVEAPEILGSGGGIVKMVKDNWDWCHGAGILVQNGDTIGGIDMSQLLKSKKQSSFAVSKYPQHLKQYNPLWLKKNGEWDGIGKKPPHVDSIPAHFLGAYYLSPKLVKEVNGPDFEIKNQDLFNGIWRPMTQRNEVFESCEYHFEAKQLEPFWFDMTTQQHLLTAQKHLMAVLSKPLSQSIWGQCLAKRYPGLMKISGACWSNCSNSENTLEWDEGPALFISKRPPISKFKMSVNSCFIDENIESNSQIKNKSPMELKNSVVLIKPFNSNENKEAKSSLSGKIEDAICIV